LQKASLPYGPVTTMILRRSLAPWKAVVLPASYGLVRAYAHVPLVTSELLNAVEELECQYER
jgi:hypothetical protein